MKIPQSRQSIIMEDMDAHRSDMEKLKRSNARLRSALKDVRFSLRHLTHEDLQRQLDSITTTVKLALEDVEK